MTHPRLLRRPHPTASRDRTAPLLTLQPISTTMSFANLKGFPPRPFADQRKLLSVVLSGPPWLKRCSSWPFVDKKVFVALRGQKGVLRDPSRPFADQRKVFSDPSRPFRIKERCSPRPSASADKKGVLRDPSRPFADQRKVFLTALRGQTRSPSRKSTANQPK